MTCTAYIYTYTKFLHVILILAVLFVRRSSSYDPFLDLSVPIHRESEHQPARSFLGTIRSSMGGGGGGAASSSGGGDANKSTLEKCLEKFTGKYCGGNFSVLSRAIIRCIISFRVLY